MAKSRGGKQYDKTWDEAVRMAAPHGASVGIDTDEILFNIKGDLGCEPPPWDQGHTYRIIRKGKTVVVQRLVGGNWEAAPLEPPREHSAPPSARQAERKTSIRIFISHSSEDVEIVKALITFIEAAVEVPQRTIRCTSVPGYKLEGGDDGPDVLRDDLESSDVVIGVFTANSVQSAFVLMELGAGWVFRKRRIPLIGPGAAFSDLKGPYHNLHGIRLDSAEDMATVPETIAKHTGFRRTGNDGKTTAALKELQNKIQEALAEQREKVEKQASLKHVLSTGVGLGGGAGGGGVPTTSPAPPALGEGDIKIALRAWLRKQRTVEGKRYSEIDMEAQVPSGSARCFLGQCLVDSWSIAESGENLVTLARGPELVRDVASGMDPYTGSGIDAYEGAGRRR